jgi:hypothetical protein
MADAGKTAARAGGGCRRAGSTGELSRAGCGHAGFVHLLLAWLTLQLVQALGASASNEASLTALG